MSNKIFVAAALAAALCASAVTMSAQTNIQMFYDFGKDRGHLTTTIEGFYQDNWGSTFFFVDHDFNSRDKDERVYAPNGTYMEISRSLNFWKESVLSPLSLHVEYNGGVYNGYTVNNAFLFGADWFFHSADFKNTLTLSAMYKTINYAGGLRLDGKSRSTAVPLQFTLVWGMQDLFGVPGLRFSGFADFWGEDHSVYPYSADASGYRDFTKGEDVQFVFISEPQIWYNVGRFVGVDNLNLGSEIELSWNFGNGKGFFVRPCLGAKWVF